MNTTNKLFSKNFTLVVAGQIISLFGNSILRFAVPLYLLRQTGSEALFGLVSALSFLPMIVLSLLGGVLADRANKKYIMVILDFFTAGLMLLFSLALGNLPMIPLFIAALMLLYGIQGAYQPAVQASIPLLVSETNLLSGNAVINQVSALANLLGPVFGGVLFSTWGLRPILLISVLCFLASAIMEIFIKLPHVPLETESGTLAVIRSDLAESFRYMKQEKPILLQIAGLLVLFNLFLGAMLMIGLPVLITKTLGMSDQLFGYSQGMLAAGGLAGGMITGLLGSKLKVQKVYILLFLSSCPLFPMALTLWLQLPAGISYLIITGGSFFLMALTTSFTIQMLSFVQLETPSHLVGKIISCLMALSMCAMPLGQSLYGALFQALAHVPWVILLGAGLISCIISRYSRGLFKKL